MRPFGDNAHGIWARTLDDPAWRLQINLEPVAGGDWIYRRDPRVRRPLDEVIWRPEGLPFVNPAVQLLWKAKHTIPKDDVDFDHVVPLLPAGELEWLAGAIAVAHAESRWLARLR